MLLTPAQIKPESFESRWNFFFFTRGGCVSRIRAFLGARLLPQSYQYPNLSEGADRVGGQLRENKECPFSDVTKSGRVWRKVLEGDARSVGHTGKKDPRKLLQRRKIRSGKKSSKKVFRLSSDSHRGAERSRVRVPAGAAGVCSSPGSTFCADSYFGIRSNPVLPQEHVKDPGHSAKTAGGRLQLNTHTPLYMWLRIK